MSNLVLVLVCLLLGLLFQRIRQFPPNAPAVLNAYVIYVALPALVLHEIPALEIDHRVLLPVAAAWVIMLCCAFVIFFTAKYFSWSRDVTGAMMLAVTLGNTGFVGIPLIEAHLGRDAIAYAILYDQFGTFIALNTYGIFIVNYYSGKQAKWGELWANIIKFPPFIALLAGFVLLWLGTPLWLEALLPRISSTLVPVVMVAVGLQWQFKVERQYLTPLVIGILYSLVLTPAFALVLVWSLGIEGIVAQVIVLEAAMPAMISAGVLAMSYNLAPRLTSSLIGYSLMLSLVTVWLWRLLMG
jgi:predicted permease